MKPFNSDSLAASLQPCRAFIRPWVAALFGVAFATTANAAPVFYTSRALFESDLASYGLTAAVEGFEPGQDTLDVPSLSFFGVDIENPGFGSGAELNHRHGFVLTGDGFVSYLANGVNVLSFKFGSAINAFGIDVFDAVDIASSGASVSLSTSHGASQILLNSPLPDGSITFVGFIDLTQSFTQVDLLDNHVGDGIAFDQLTTASVPDAGSTLLTFGFASLALLLSKLSVRPPQTCRIKGKSAEIS